MSLFQACSEETGKSPDLASLRWTGDASEAINRANYLSSPGSIMLSTDTKELATPCSGKLITSQDSAIVRGSLLAKVRAPEEPLGG